LIQTNPRKVVHFNLHLNHVITMTKASHSSETSEQTYTTHDKNPQDILSNLCYELV